MSSRGFFVGLGQDQVEQDGNHAAQADALQAEAVIADHHATDTEDQCHRDDAQV